jgi:hypothetical protein
LLIFFAAWFGVVMPVHRRGVVRLPGAAAYAKSCCGPSRSPHEGSKPKSSDPLCAVCHFLATLDRPAAVGVDVPPLGLAEELRLPAPAKAPVVERVAVNFERGPPVA